MVFAQDEHRLCPLSYRAFSGIRRKLRYQRNPHESNGGGKISNTNFYNENAIGQEVQANASMGNFYSEPSYAKKKKQANLKKYMDQIEEDDENVRTENELICVKAEKRGTGCKHGRSQTPLPETFYTDCSLLRSANSGTEYVASDRSEACK